MIPAMDNEIMQQAILLQQETDNHIQSAISYLREGQFREAAAQFISAAGKLTEIATLEEAFNEEMKNGQGEEGASGDERAPESEGDEEPAGEAASAEL